MVLVFTQSRAASLRTDGSAIAHAALSRISVCMLFGEVFVHADQLPRSFGGRVLFLPRHVVVRSVQGPYRISAQGRAYRGRCVSMASGNDKIVNLPESKAHQIHYA